MRHVKLLGILLSIAWYVAGSVWLYALWTDSFSLVDRERAAVAARLDDCLRKVQESRRPDPTAEAPERAAGQITDATLTEAACQDAYRKALPAEKPSDAEKPYLATAIVLCLPALLYGLSRFAVVYEVE